MAKTVRASKSGLQRVDEARRMKGWNKQDPAWFDLALTTKATLKNFWAGKPIQTEVFEIICKTVGIEVWQEIVDLSIQTSPKIPSRPYPFSAYNPDTFTGRDAEIAQFTTLLSGSCRILAITGMTGIGKTALAERVIANLMEIPKSSTLPYIRFSLDDRSLSPDLSISGAALLRVLGEEPTLADQQDAANLSAHILKLLCSRPCRLQIDSLERLLKGNEQEGWSEFCDPLWLELLHQLLAGNDCPSQLVLTSQDIPGELDAVASRYPQFWKCQTLQGLSIEEQQDFFQKLGLPVNVNAATVEPNYLNQIGVFYDGHPLALQVIADEILQHPFQGDIARYWHHYEAEFVATAAATNTVSRSSLFRRRVRQRVEQTLQRLPSNARQMLCASAVFRRPVPIDFWLAMLTEDSQIAFDTLRDRHLVEFVPTSDNTSLACQHNLIRSIAYELLKKNSFTWQQAERQAVGLWINAYRPKPDVPNLEIARGYLEAIAHLHNAKDWDSVISLADIQFESGNSLGSQLFIWGYYQEYIVLQNQLLSSAQGIKNRQNEGCTLTHLGNVHHVLGDYQRALGYYRSSLKITREMGDRCGEGINLGALGITYGILGEHEKAFELCRQSLTIAREVKDLRGEGAVLGNLGNLYSYYGQYEDAIGFFQQHLTIARATGNRQGEGIALANIGESELKLEQYPESLTNIQAGLEIFQEIGNKYNESHALKNLAELYQALNKIEVARQYCYQALALADELRIPLAVECKTLLQTLETQLKEQQS
jgi:tetratricopeptide (TPR) repeat protein